MLFRTIANSDSFVCIVLSSGRGSGDVAQQAALGSHIKFQSNNCGEIMVGSS